MGVLLIGVQHHRIPVLKCELLAREFPSGRQNFVRGCRVGHRKHDVMDQLRGTGGRTSVARGAVLAGREFKMPVTQERLLGVAAGDTVTFVGLDGERPLTTDVRKVGGDGAYLRAAPGPLAGVTGWSRGFWRKQNNVTAQCLAGAVQSLSRQIPPLYVHLEPR